MCDDDGAGPAEDDEGSEVPQEAKGRDGDSVGASSADDDDAEEDTPSDGGEAQDGEDDEPVADEEEEGEACKDQPQPDVGRCIAC